MEFKVFKNENDKILKEYWLTQSEWDALDKTTVQEGDIYHIVGTIDKGDLSADVNASLAKADSSLQKPTNDSTGTIGQVLKKTETGSEWANESGGGKLYLHAVKVKSSGIYEVPALDFKLISTSNTPITKDNIIKNKSASVFDLILSGDDATMPPFLYIARSFLATPDSVSVSYFKTYPTKSDSTSSIEIGSGGNYSVADVITEL